jgi:hypothetical protein
VCDEKSQVGTGLELRVGAEVAALCCRQKRSSLTSGSEAISAAGACSHISAPGSRCERVPELVLTCPLGGTGSRV